ncbi:MAG: hypothetical protein ABIQ40_15885 [Bacteroidia bacterium]
MSYPDEENEKVVISKKVAFAALEVSEKYYREITLVLNNHLAECLYDFEKTKRGLFGTVIENLKNKYFRGSSGANTYKSWLETARIRSYSKLAILDISRKIGSDYTLEKHLKQFPKDDEILNVLVKKIEAILGSTIPLDF